jgi:nucleotide-binding universal stress UspA family protein
MSAFKHILVPTDFGKASQRALEVALELAVQNGAKLTLLHVYELPEKDDDIDFEHLPADRYRPFDQAVREPLDAALASARASLPTATALLRSGHPRERILEVTRESGVDLVVMGTHGHRGILHALIGSVAERIVQLSPVPVLTVRARVEDEGVVQR